MTPAATSPSRTSARSAVGRDHADRAPARAASGGRRSRRPRHRARRRSAGDAGRVLAGPAHRPRRPHLRRDPGEQPVGHLDDRARAPGSRGRAPRRWRWAVTPRWSDRLPPRVGGARRGGLGEVAEHRHRPARAAPGEGPQLHRREVLGLVHHDVAVGASASPLTSASASSTTTSSATVHGSSSSLRAPRRSSSRCSSAVRMPSAAAASAARLVSSPLGQGGAAGRRPDAGDRGLEVACSPRTARSNTSAGAAPSPAPRRCCCHAEAVEPGAQRGAAGGERHARARRSRRSPSPTSGAVSVSRPQSVATTTSSVGRRRVARSAARPAPRPAGRRRAAALAPAGRRPAPGAPSPTTSRSIVRLPGRRLAERRQHLGDVAEEHRVRARRRARRRGRAARGARRGGRRPGAGRPRSCRCPGPPCTTRQVSSGDRMTTSCSAAIVATMSRMAPVRDRSSSASSGSGMPPMWPWAACTLSGSSKTSSNRSSRSRAGRSGSAGAGAGPSGSAAVAR